MAQASAFTGFSSNRQTRGLYATREREKGPCLRWYVLSPNESRRKRLPLRRVPVLMREGGGLAGKATDAKLIFWLRIAEWIPVKFRYPEIEPCAQALSEVKPIPYRPFRWGAYK
jgi:hypothetical protein